MLIECIKQLGKSLTSVERKTLEDSFNDNVSKGMPEKEAGVAAIHDFHSTVKEQFADLYRAAGVSASKSKAQALTDVFSRKFDDAAYKKAQPYLKRLVTQDASMSDVVKKLSDNGASLSTIRAAKPYIVKYLEDGGKAETTPKMSKEAIAAEFEDVKPSEQKADSAPIKSENLVEQKGESAQVKSEKSLEPWQMTVEDYVRSQKTPKPEVSFGLDVSSYQLSRMSEAAKQRRWKENAAARQEQRAAYNATIKGWNDSVVEAFRRGSISFSDLFLKADDGIIDPTDAYGPIADFLNENGIDTKSPFHTRQLTDKQRQQYVADIQKKAVEKGLITSDLAAKDDKGGLKMAAAMDNHQIADYLERLLDKKGLFYRAVDANGKVLADTPYSDVADKIARHSQEKSNRPVTIETRQIEKYHVYDNNNKYLFTTSDKNVALDALRKIYKQTKEPGGFRFDGELWDSGSETVGRLVDAKQSQGTLKKLADASEKELEAASKRKLSADFLSKIDVTQKGSRIELGTPETVELLRKAENAAYDQDTEIFKGQFTEPKQARALADALDVYAETAKEKGIDAAPIEGFRDAIVKASEAGEGVAFYSNQPSQVHETGHQAGYKAADVGAKDLMKRRGDVRKYYTPDHIWKTALKSYNHYFKNTYFRGMDFDKLSYRQKAMLAEEMSVFAMSGDFAKIGLTLDEATTFLIYDWKAQIAVSGEGVLDELIKYYSEFEFDTSNLEAIRTEINEQSNQNQAVERGQGVASNEGKPQKAAESAVQPGKADTSGRREDAETGGERKRSLPETIRRAGLEAKDESYMVFHDADAVEQAADMLTESGLDNTINYLLKAEGYSKRDAVLSFQAQSVIQERAAELEEQGKFDEAKTLKTKGLEIAHRHAQFATEAGQFIQASAILAKSRQAVLFRASAIAQANGKELTTGQYDEFSALGENGAEVYAQNKMLRQQIADLEKRLEEIQKEKKSTYKERVPRRYVSIAREHLGDHDALVREARAMLRNYNETLKMAADDVTARKEAIIENITERDPFIKAAAKIGASLMLDKPMHKISRENFTKEMIGIFGEDVVTSFELIFAEAFNLRRKLLSDARAEARAKRLKDKASEKEHESALKRVKSSIAQKLANLYSPRVTAQKEDLIDAVFEMADSDEAAEMATRILLKDINLTEESRKNRKLVIEANNLIEEAKQQIITEKEQLQAEALETKERLAEVQREELKQRQEIAAHNAAVAKSLRRLTEHPIKFYTKEILKGIGEVRSVALSTDIGTVLRQGFKYNFAEPASLLKSIPALAKSVKENGYLDVIRAIENHPDFHLWERMGIKFGFKTGEEQIYTEYFKKVPLLRQFLEVNERLFHSFLDAQRACVAEAMVKRLRNKGIEFKDNPKAYRDIGYTINISTGKGEIKSANVQGAIDTVGTIFLAPKYAISRFQLLNEMAGPGLAKYSPEVRGMIVRQNVQTIAIAATITALLAKALGSAVSFDPEDDDFLKIRIGDKARYEFTGGIQTYIKLPAMYLKRGVMALLGIKPSGNSNLIDKTESWLSYKLAPLPSYIYFGVKGREVGGTPWHPGWSAAQRVVPISIREAWQAYQMDGMPGVAMVLPNVVGVGTGYYKDKESSTSDEQKQLKERIKLGDLSKADAIQKLREDVKNGKLTNAQMKARIRSFGVSDITEQIRTSKDTYQGAQKLYELVDSLKAEDAQDAVDALSRKAIAARRDRSLKGQESAGIYEAYVKQISEKFNVQPRGALKMPKMKIPGMARIRP